MENVSTQALPGSVAAGHLSFFEMFEQADLVVKAVMIMLLRAVFRRSRKFEDAFWASASMEDLYDKIAQNPKDPKAAVFCAGMKEWQTAGRSAASSELKLERIERVMDVAIRRETEYLEGALPLLASIGSTAPFVGLFGTVWGIMNSFQGIAAAKNTSLAVVAPGIAEALAATALGLVAAIPAVLAYNAFAGDISKYAAQLEAFADEFLTIISRQLSAAA